MAYLEMCLCENRNLGHHLAPLPGFSLRVIPSNSSGLLATFGGSPSLCVSGGR
jgi:hypothetical protein